MLTKWPEQINQNGCFCHLPYIPEHVWGEVPSTHLKAPGRSTRVEVTVWWDREDQQAVSRAWISQPDLLHGLLHRYLYWMNIHQLDLSVSLSLSGFSKRVGVFCCGPKGISKTLHKLCNSARSSGTTFEFNKESFGWSNSCSSPKKSSSSAVLQSTKPLRRMYIDKLYYYFTRITARGYKRPSRTRP